MNAFAALILLAQATIPTPAPSPQVPAVPAVAPGYAAPAVSPPPPGIVGVTQQPFVGITLQNAIGMALSQNPDLAVAQANRRIAQYQILAAKGAYDVNFSVEPQYQYSASPPQNVFFAGPGFGAIVNQNAQIASGVQGITPGGQQYSVNVSAAQTYNNTTINTFNPTYPSVFSVNFVQPLSRGRATNQAAHALELAQINASTTTAQTLATVSTTIAAVQNTYWDLVAAWRNVAIQETALRDTITQQHSNVRMARQGAAAPIDVVQANAQIAAFRQDMFSALQQVALLQNQLKSQLASNPSDPIWNANLVPTSPLLQLPAQPALSALVAQALANRPEIAQLRDQLRAAAANLRYAQDQTKPQVNLVAGYASNGFAGTVIPPGPFLAGFDQLFANVDALVAAYNSTVPPSSRLPLIPSAATPVPSYLQGGLGKSIQNLLSSKFPAYNAGVQVSFPIGDTTARANLNASLEQQRALQIQEASTVARVTADVRNGLQSYQSALAQLDAASAARQAAQQILASEKRRFRAGESTTYLVLQREIELADDRGREVQAQTNLNKAVVELQRATGSILSANNVDVTTIGAGALK